MNDAGYMDVRPQDYTGIRVVESDGQARELLKLLREYPGPFGLDCETVDIDPRDESPVLKGRIVCWSVAWQAHPVRSHPRGMLLASRAFLWSDQLHVFKDWLEDHRVPKVGHNIFTFDRHMFMNAGINLQGIIGDTLRMSRFLNADSSAEHGLKSLMQRVLGYTPVGEYTELFSRAKASPVEDLGASKLTRRKVVNEFIPTLVGGEHQRLYTAQELIPLDDIRPGGPYEWLQPTLHDYASLDAKATLELFHFLRTIMRKRPAKRLGGTTTQTLWELYESWWNPGLLQLTEYERAGVDIDLERCAQSSAALIPDIEAQAAIVRAWSGETNWRSGPQGPRFLYDVKQFDVPRICGSKLEAAKRTKRGKRPADFVALTTIADDPWTAPDDKAGIRAVLAWRALVKAKEFSDKFKDYLAADGRVHTVLAPEADTGRLSSRNPALQQIPKRDKYRVRRAFVAPPGYKLIVADYSQLELYVAAHFMKVICHDNTMADMLTSGDMHVAMAQRAWPHELAGLSPEQLKAHPRRDHAKAIGYGLFYGKTAQGLGLAIRNDSGEPIGTEAAQVILDAYHAAVPSLAVLQQYFIDYAREHWGVHTLLGRFRPLAGIHSEDKYTQGEAERAALNTPIQGSAHDIVATAMLRTNTSALEELAVRGYLHHGLTRAGVHGCLQVHDELQWRVRADMASEAAELVRAVMENPLEPGVFSIPLKVDIHVTDNWGDK
jgi:DNA polymerase I-like protein with 3'-5' exonuclease and polymerase domains